jgi:DNA repair protein RecN (Recombination protein N)
MLAELRVRDLGVIEDLHIVLGDGMTAITGETGAGKTLVVEAIELLVGGRGDPSRVRAGATEAVVEGRFVGPDGEIVLSRVVPASGRSRAYVDGRMAAVAELAELGGGLVDLHGQHAHQSLLSAAVQRAALDRFAGVDLGPRADARAAIRAIDEELTELGGDERERARELDLLRFQVDELRAARLDDAAEDEALAAEEVRLADATALREAAALAWSALGAEGGASDAVATASAALGQRPVFEEHAARLRAVAAELADVAGELRAAEDTLLDDPARLTEVQQRRQVLTALRRKYGDTLADVIAFAAEAERRLDDLAGYDERAAALDADRAAALDRLSAAETAVGDARRKHAARLGKAVEKQLPDLALGGATFVVEVGNDRAGDDVSFLFSANRGEPARALA